MSVKPNKVSLTGRMYQENDQWWSEISLPGGTRIRVRLKVDAEKAAKSQADVDRKIETGGQVFTEAERREQVEAELRAEVEQATARANAEARLRLEAERRARMEAQARSIAEARLKAETELRAEAEQKAAYRVEGVSPSNRGRDARDTVAPASDGSLRSYLESSEAVSLSGCSTALCEGCGRDEVPESDLSRIDSGQLICSDCLMLTKA